MPEYGEGEGLVGGSDRPRSDVGFGDGMRQAVADVQRQRSAGVRLSDVAQAAVGRSIRGVNSPYGAQVVVSRISNGWLLSDGRGWQAAAMTDGEAITAVVNWCCHLLGEDPAPIRIHRGPESLNRAAPLPPHACIGVRRLANGWIVSTFDDTLEMVALDAEGAAGVVLDWMGRFPSNNQPR